MEIKLDIDALITQGESEMLEFRNISDGFMVTVYSEKSSKKDVVENGKQNYGLNVGKNVGKDVGKDLGEVQKLILRLIYSNPGMTIREMASRLNLTTRTIERNIAQMKKLGLLKRQNGKKGGYWESK
jgi:ATP-dependent DNA helicase RecG